MTFRLVGLAVPLAALFIASGAQGAIVYSQTPTPNQSNFSDPDSGFYYANGFSISSTDTVRSVTWQGVYASNDSPITPDSFTIKFYTDSSGIPGAEAGSFVIGAPTLRMDTGGTLSGFNLFEYTANLGPGISLSSSQDYWISIFNDTTADANDNWAWALASPGTAPTARSTDDLVTWSALGTVDFYFILDNVEVVPIPAAVWLFGSALGLLGWLKRRS